MQSCLCLESLGSQGELKQETPQKIVSYGNIYIYIYIYRKVRLMKQTHDSLLLRVSCLRTHQTVFNKENSYQQVYIQACEKSYCYYVITMHVRELSKGVGPE